MPSNPERMRPTAASNTEIMKRTNLIALNELRRATDEAEKKSDGPMLKTIYQFLHNHAGEPKEIKGEQQ
jgi:hypothetical protein